MTLFADMDLLRSRCDSVLTVFTRRFISLSESHSPTNPGAESEENSMNRVSTAPADTYSSYLATFTEVAIFLRKWERDVSRTIFFADLAAYCAMINNLHHPSPQNITAVVGGDDEIFDNTLKLLATTIRSQITDASQSLSIRTITDSDRKLKSFQQRWSKIPLADSHTKLQFTHAYLDFGGPEDREQVIVTLSMYQNSMQKLRSEGFRGWISNECTPRPKFPEVSPTVRPAAHAIFNALAASNTCSSPPQHEFEARLSLGTYRKPRLKSETDLDFGIFLSMEQAWYEARVQATEKMAITCVVEPAVELSQRYSSRRKVKPMRVKCLCGPIAKIQTKAFRDTYRLEFEVTSDQLFKLQSAKSSFRVDRTKEAVSLDQLLRIGARFTGKTKRILNVLLSSAVLHLHKTPWLSTTWSSSDVLFFRTASSAIPLKPFIQVRLSGIGNGCLSRDEAENAGCLTLDGTASGAYDDTDPDDIDPDDVDCDPDDTMPHHCPMLVSLAVILMEIYFKMPFEDLARKYGETLPHQNELQTNLTYLVVDTVFKACHEEMPENTQFHFAVERCLDSMMWEDEQGNKLDDDTLRSRIYDNIVHPLEIELTQAHSSIPIEDLDTYAQDIDFTNWNQPIDSWDQLSCCESSQDFLSAPRNESSRRSSLGIPHSICPPLSDHNHVGALACPIPETNTPISGSNTPNSALSFGVVPMFSPRFFDDETIP